MADFLIAHRLVVDEEGLYSNNEADSGGETVLGLTRNTDRNWDGWKLVDQYKLKPNYPDNLKGIKTALDTLAQPYYKKKYWNVMRGDEINDQDVANKIYSTEVNGGNVGVKFAQRSLGLADSGTMDDVTLNALNNMA